MIPLILLILTVCITNIPLAQAPVPKSWHKIEADVFTFYLPPTMKLIDSKLCEECSWGSSFANDGIRLIAETSSWSAEWAPQYLAKQHEYVKEIGEIGGKKAKIQSWRAEDSSQGFGYLAEARYYGIHGKLVVRVSAFCKDQPDLEIAKQIFRTVGSFK